MPNTDKNRMNMPYRRSSRRAFLGTLALGTSALTARGAFAEELTRTPTTNEGPFFPKKLPLDTDNDLLIINDAITPAVGEITHLGGRLLDSRGKPLRSAVIEIWQCDKDGIYLKQHQQGQEKFDTNFQGYGRFLTSSTGEYYFRTIKPVPYRGRPAAHIHARIWKGDKKLLTTECFIKGFPSNERDGQFKQIRGRDPKGHEMLCLDFAPLSGSKIGELAAKWDIVLGFSPEA
jgi:protocatechuate 3,4-dioxygenase, beta subunit